MATITGGEGDDTLTGTNSADQINGRGGNDTIEGRGGNDAIDGGAGDDTVDAGEGDDRVIVGSGSDMVLGGAGADWILHSAGAFEQWHGEDEFFVSLGGPASDADRRLYGGAGDDVIVSMARAGIIDAGDGDDIVGGHAPTVLLGAGDDWYRPGSQIRISGDHVIDGGDGYDVLDLNEHYRDEWDEPTDFSVLRGFEKWVLHEHWLGTYVVTDTNISGGLLEIEVSAWDLRTLDASALTVGAIRLHNSYNRAYAEYGQSVVLGGALDDAMYGGSNVDEFRGNGGDDYFDGGDGTDIAVFSGAAADYELVELTYNTFTVRNLRGIDGTDTIVDVNVLRFSDGDVPVVIRGMKIVGDESDETISGGDEADYVDGAGGDDVVSGADGNDCVLGGVGEDRVRGGAGDDLLEGGNGADLLLGGGGDDEVEGGAGNDLIASDGAGSDEYVGGSGVDTVSYAALGSALTIDLTAGTAEGAGMLADSLSSIENATGGGAADRILGSGAANLLVGNGGGDRIDGGRGGDALDGGLGSDRLFGGKGADRFVFDSLGDSAKGSARDRIGDFERKVDEIDLSGIDADAVRKGNQAFGFVGDDRFDRSAGELRFANGILSGDVDGDGKADFEIAVAGKLAAVDILL
jgi:Ca2+-binding RTX toxin-like protein